MSVYYGIDIGGTTVKLGMFAGEGELLDKWEIPTRKENNGSLLFRDIAEEGTARAAAGGIGREEIQGIGCGIPGPVEENGFVESCVNLGIRHITPALLLRKYVGGIPVVFANDANVAALGEMWKGGGRGYKSIVFVTLGTGVGSGVIINRQMVYGAKGLAGEIGHIMINPNETERCNCGGMGCLDQMASARGIVRCAKKFLEEDFRPSLLRDMGELTARKILDAAKRGDETASRTVSHCMFYLGKCLAEVSYIVDPQAFVIGGGVSGAGEYLLEHIRRHYNQFAILKQEKADICLAKLGNDAGIYGAARLVYDLHEEVKGR